MACSAGSSSTVDASRSYFDTCVEDHPHYYWEADGRLTDHDHNAGGR